MRPYIKEPNAQEINTLTLLKSNFGRDLYEGVFHDFKKIGKHIYRKEDVLNEVSKLQQEIKNGNLLGEMGHPDRFEVSLNNASHKIDSVWYDQHEDCILGRLEILEETPKGGIIKQLLDEGVKLSVGMRASGTVTDAGYTDIERIHTFDIIPNKPDDMIKTNEVKLGGILTPGNGLTSDHDKLENMLKGEDDMNHGFSMPSFEKPIIEKNSKSKKLLIFAVYIPIGSQSESKSRTRLNEMKQSIEHTFKMLEYQSNCVVRSFIYASKDDLDSD